MAGTIILCDLRVISRDLRGITYHQGDRSTGSLPFKDAGEKLHLIGLFTLSGNGTGAGFTSV